MGHPEIIALKNGNVEVSIRIDTDGAAYLEDVHSFRGIPNGSFDGTERGRPSPHSNPSLPLVEVRLSGEGNHSYKTAKALIGSYVSNQMRYKSHREHAEGTSKTLDIELYHEQAKITVLSHLTIFDGLPFLRATSSIKNDGHSDVVVTQLTSIVVGGLTNSPKWWHDYELLTAKNTWFRETQWQTHSLPSVGLDDTGIHELPDDHVASLAYFSLSNHSSFSTQGHLPMGLLQRKDRSETWMWQVENNGSWRWDLGDYKNSLYVAASGPEAANHDWRQRLGPGESFTSCAVAVCHIHDDAESAFGALAHYRRRIRRKHPDHEHLPIIFNDYMNCLMGDPTDEKILALVDPVVKSGAEYFVIDCGWYADDQGWWDDVGLWEPSKKRFPMGFKNLLDKIQEKGLKPGLWIETEVVGVRNVMARQLPYEAFFQRDGERVVEKGRYQLDYRHPAVRKRMDEVVDNLVQNYRVKYFKFDYNIEVVQGTDISCSSSGVGQLEHGRAYLRWISSLLDRYPGLVLENCSSGAQRMDYAMLSHHTLQSTSDQQDPVRYAAIAAAIHTAVTPEQGATWAYPQGGWSDEINALTVVNSLLGRVHLSGRLDQMSDKQLNIIYEGMKVYKAIRGDIAESTPFWPLGLPGWHDEWLALGMLAQSGSRSYVAVWRRGGTETSCSLSIKAFRGRTNVQVEMLYPAKFEGDGTWEAGSSSLRVKLPNTTCARLFRLESS